jgi:IS1 family transposase
MMEGRDDHPGVALPLLPRDRELWGFVARKMNPRWLWHAIDHHTGLVIGLFINRYEFGRAI